MEKVIDRVNRLIAALGYNDNSFSKRANLSIGNLSYVRSKGTDISGENIRRILEAFPEVSREWLMFGSGEMFNEKSSQLNNNVNTLSIGNVGCSEQKSTPSDNHLNLSNNQDLIKALLNQQEITLKAQELARKQQEQSERLLNIIEHLQNS